MQVDTTVLVTTISTIGVIIVGLGTAIYSQVGATKKAKIEAKSQLDKIKAESEAALARVQAEIEAKRDDLELAAKVKQEQAEHDDGLKRAIAGMRDMATIRIEMENLQSIGVGRVATFAIRNGGKIPQPGKPLFAHSIDVVAIDKNHADKVLRDYKNYELMPDYAEMCAEILANIENPKYRFHVDTDKPQRTDGRLTQLEEIYKSEGIKESWIFGLAYKVHRKNNGDEAFVLYIMSLAIYKGASRLSTMLNSEDVPFDGEPADNEFTLKHIDQAALYTSLNNIRQVMRKYYT